MRKNGEMSLEMISGKTVPISNSVPCKVLVIGFFCGVCIASSISAVFTNAHKAALVYSSSHDAISKNSRLFYPENNTNGCSIVIQQNLQVVKKVSPSDKDQRIMNIYNAWSSSLNGETLDSSLPHPPHVEDCKLNIERNTRHDKWTEDGSFPNWIFWKGYLGTESIEDLGNNPPWIEGSDEENYPLTRRVQRDIWMHQHPRDCKNPNLTFLIADWTSLRGLGFGAQLASMAGLLGIAMQEKRILVTNYFNRADHSGCKGKNRSQWSCYFFSETSMECKDRAFELMSKQDVLMNGLVKLNENYTSKEIWIGSTPRLWGKPWNNLQRTTEIDGKLLTKHRKMNIKWWRAQAVRYLMRYKTNYTCQLLNKARNEAFGIQAAKIVTENLSAQLPKVINNASEIESEMERLVWSHYKPWIPRPLLSVHVRIGDKAGEMKIFEFEKYMELADRIRERFPNLKNIWLSTEMQEVINKTRLYTNWTFYYTNVARQAGNTSVATYEGTLGRELSTNYPLVNFLLASEADFFVGALGSTWCYLIDGMRNTGGKVMAGYLSVNKDRFW